jgi:hypothetical protein
LAVFALLVGCTLFNHPNPNFPKELFPDRKGLVLVMFDERPGTTQSKEFPHYPDKLITADYQSYIQSNKVASILGVRFYQDGTGWHAIQINELVNVGNGRKWLVHILEYDKSDVRIKVRQISWTDRSF